MTSDELLTPADIFAALQAFHSDAIHLSDCRHEAERLEGQVAQVHREIEKLELGMAESRRRLLTLVAHSQAGDLLAAMAVVCEPVEALPAAKILDEASKVPPVKPAFREFL